MKGKRYLILDTETATLTGEVFDIAWVICEKRGNIVHKRNFLVREVLQNPNLMMGAYFAKKVFTDYIPMIEQRKVDILQWTEIAKHFRQDFRQHNVEVICAYNLPFDMRAIRQMVKIYGDSPLVKRKVDLLCLWETCCRLRLNTVGYKAFADKNGFITDAGNFRTSAECAYRFMTFDPTFVESHTALRDCEIEAQLLAWCLKRKKKIPYNHLGGQPWRLLKSI